MCNGCNLRCCRIGWRNADRAAIFARICSIAAAVLALTGCAGPVVAPVLPAVQTWQDASFHFDPRGAPTPALESPADVFGLDDDILADLRSSDQSLRPTAERLAALLAHVYGDGGIRMSYALGRTTGATQTWRNREGDCLSLTIMVYAAATALGIPAHMQEVRIPLTIDRRDGIDYIVGHVNVLVRHPQSLTVQGRNFVPGGLIIDFEPQLGSRVTGLQLSQSQTMARFYNNRAVEHLATSDDRAYAYYRAAIEADPRFAPAYANLAQLYQRKGLMDSAERLLLQAIALNPMAYAPLRAMQDLLQAQGRPLEAQQFAERLRQQQDRDPYHWLGQGVGALHAGQNAAAVKALERAAELTTGFEEIHHHLAIAYARNGQREQAARQIALLDTLLRHDPEVARLGRKLLGAPQAEP